MRLGELIKDIENLVLYVKPSNMHSKNNLLNADIEGLSLNSKEVKKGYLFFCLSGTRFRGCDFINEAHQNGAIAIVTDEDLPDEIYKNVVVIRVKDIIECLGRIANKFYDYPWRKLNMTAITGTNGKTTITFILESILNSYNKPAGVIGTVNYRFNNKVFSAKNTTPDILAIHNLIDKMLKDKIQYLLMEVSSHALAQRRIEGLKFNQAIFTNLSQDHFDYHITQKKYFLAKSLLFKDYLKDDGTAIINIDDVYGLKLLDLIKKDKKKRILTYGIKGKADISADKILLKHDSSCFFLRTPKYKFKLKTNLLGIFNIYNILASVGVSSILDIPQSYIMKGLEKVYVPGRLERVNCNHNMRIFVDYAHTQEALRNVLLTLKEIKDRRRLIVVFGCGGDRDKTKRSKMGKVASELSDFVIITSDNPRSEDPKKIISDIKRGIGGKNYISIVDRKEAIKKAIDMAKSKDIIVVAGKGHEDYQIVKEKKFYFNDRVVIENILSRKGFI